MQTTQEYFDETVRHLLKQKERSQGHASCLYRSRTGREEGAQLACAIGCHIPDSVYKSAMDDHGEGMGVEDLLRLFPDLEVYLQPGQLKKKYGQTLNQALQVVHDDYEPSEWKYQLEQVANEFGLTFTTIGE